MEHSCESPETDADPSNKPHNSKSAAANSIADTCSTSSSSLPSSVAKSTLSPGEPPSVQASVSAVQIKEEEAEIFCQTNHTSTKTRGSSLDLDLASCGSVSAGIKTNTKNHDRDISQTSSAEVLSHGDYAEDVSSLVGRSVFATGKQQINPTIPVEKGVTSALSCSVTDEGSHGSKTEGCKKYLPDILVSHDTKPHESLHPHDDGISIPTTPNSSDKMMTVTHYEKENTSNDQSNNADTMLEEDSVPNLIITNVFSIREEDANFSEDVDGGETGSSNYEASSQPRSVLTENSSLQLGESASAPSQASDSYASHAATSILDSTFSIPLSSGSTHPSAGSHGHKKCETLVLDFSELKRRSAEEERLTGPHVRKQLCTESSASELLQAVSGLVTSERTPDSEGLLSTAPDVASLSSPVPPAVVPSLSHPQPAGSLLSATVVAGVTGLGAQENHGTDGAVVSSVQDPAGLIREPVLSSDGDADSLQDSVGASSDQTVHKVHPVARMGELPHHPEKNIPETSETLPIKPEPPDAGYETGPGVSPAASSCLSSSSSCSLISTTPDAGRPASKSNSYRKRVHSETEEGQESLVNSTDQQKRQRMAALARACSLSAKAQLKGKLDAASAAVSGVTSSQCTATTATRGSVYTACTRGPDTVWSNPAGLSTVSTSSKSLLAPSVSRTLKKPSTQGHSVPAKNVFLNLPPTLSLSRTSASQLTTSGPKGTEKNCPSSQVANAGNGSATTVTSSNQQLNEQIATHLRHVQDKPGSHQMLMIPMPDGSTHSVKVIFAPRLKPQTPAATTTSAPQAMSLAASSSESESGPAKASISTSAFATAETPSSATPVPVIQTQGARPTVVSSMLVNCTTWKPVSTQSPTQPLSRQATSSTSLLSPSTNPAHTLGSSVPPATAAASSSQPVLSHALLVMPITSLVGTKPAPQAVQGTLPSASRELQSQGSKRDVRFDQVSAEAKLSAADMAALIQGKNLVPPLEPRRRPKSFSATSKVYRCVECGMICWTLVGYTAHVKRMSMVIRYACMVCKAVLVFFNKCTFLAHLRKHTTADSATGQVLNLKSYTMSVSSLPDELLPPIDQQHMDPLVINRYQPVFCTECRESFPDSAFLASHFGFEVVTCSFKYTCTHCNMELPTSCSLKAHLRLHDEESHTVCAQPDFVCPECGLCFPNQVSLYQHLFATCLHFSRCVTLKCPICRQFHPTLDVLEEHLTTFHPNQKRYQCLLCRRKYHTHFSFLHHIPQVHKSLDSRAAAEKSYEMTGSCAACKSVTLEGKEHAQKHVQMVKSSARFGYACLFCQEAPVIFEGRNRLVQHLNKSHDAYSFVCSLCEQGFVTLSLLRSHVPLAHGALQKQQKKNEQQMCLKCSACLLGPESVVPHVMWHIVKRMTDLANQTESSQFHVNKQSLELIAPVVHARPGDPQKRMLMCRSCGHLSSTRFSLQRHISKAEHHFCRYYAVCPFCQRHDFLNKQKFEVHKERCLTDSGVHTAIVIDDSVEDEQSGARPPQCDERSENSSSTGTGVQPLSASGTGSPGNGATPAQSQSSFTAVIQKGHVATLQKKHIIIISPSSALKRPASNKPAIKGKHCRLSAGPPAPDATKAVASQAASRSSGTIRAKTSLAPRSGSNERKKTGEGEGSGESAVGGVTEVNVTVAMGTERAGSPPPVVFHPCHLCGLTYTSAIMLSNHLASIHGGEKNVLCCKLCLKKGKEVLLSKMNLKKHLTRRHNVAKPAADTMIRDMCKSRPGFTEAPDAAETQRISTAYDSSTSSSSDKSPVKRLRIAGGDQEYMCAKCSFSSPSRGQFRQHITSHAVENCVQCLECGLCFSAVSSLKKHLFMVHKVKEPASYVERHDIKLEELPTDLASHMDTLTPLGEPEVVIKTAGAYHDALHTAKPYRESWKEKRPRKGEQEGDSSLLECNVCYKEFENDAALRSHMRTHGMAFIRSRRITRQLEGQKNNQSGEELEDSENQKKTSEASAE